MLQLTLISAAGGSLVGRSAGKCDRRKGRCALQTHNSVVTMAEKLREALPLDRVREGKIRGGRRFLHYRSGEKRNDNAENAVERPPWRHVSGQEITQTIG